jgi:anti-anti-sigma factor
MRRRDGARAERRNIVWRGAERMPIENWSEHVIIVKLLNDPHVGEDLQAAAELAARKPLGVAVDLSALKFINSSQLARLLKLRKTVSTAGQRLVLCGADAQVWSAFLVTGLDKIFDFADALPTALASIQLAHPAAD